ncbi:putative lipoprotein [Hyphomonas polymorpha PS728]|uniref:Putative lipoprotein n=1 Tax=Hyphomonas polymorpha PS728 TaxID=1280954 RepID=A0A062VJA9_9PROT|nr:hypothetical protein [Hyphomonas polymorpha]KCZ98176.1 putative lipoprotein [Hyphomonas polymorpha PS728]
MKNLVKIAVGLGLAALMLTAACATNPDISPEETAERRARLAAVSLLPDCAAAQTLTGDRAERLPDCRFSGVKGLHLILKTDPLDWEMLGPSGFVSISVMDRQGRPIADFSEVIHGLYVYPQLLDVNGDRRADLIIPRSTDAVNMVYALWIQQESGDFIHAGQVTGAEIAWTAGGMIAAASRTGASDWETAYYRVTGAALQELALVHAAGSQPPRRGGRCEILRLAPGLEPTSFCAAP